MSSVGDWSVRREGKLTMDETAEHLCKACVKSTVCVRLQEAVQAVEFLNAKYKGTSYVAAICECEEFQPKFIEEGE